YHISTGSFSYYINRRGTNRCLERAQLHNGTLRKAVRTLRVKLVFLGSSGVGKSTLAQRFSKDEFRSTSPTVGCAYLTRMVHLSNVTLRLEIWDTAGQEKYHSITPLYYRGAHAALLVYDISKRVRHPDMETYWLCGSKSLRNSTSQDPPSYGSETSALSGDQVSELLLAIAHRVYECIGEQQGGLSEWQETSFVDLHHRDTFSPFASCCKVAP
uniref:Uncharacterized protein n=1 Tax=Monopterus albus TaxID=43700 RepID=A0A3Q3J3F9_MONAL